MRTHQPMKTSPKLFKLCILAALGMAITAELALTQSALATTHSLVITENSSSSLSVTLDGSSTGITVTNTGTEQWDITLSITNLSFLGNARFNWIEPESSNKFNGVYFGPQGIDGVNLQENEMLVFSDSTPLDASSLKDGVPTPFVVGGIEVNGDIEAIYATFHDNAASSEPNAVSDTGSAFDFLLLSLIGLFGVTRLPSLGLA